MKTSKTVKKVLCDLAIALLLGFVSILLSYVFTSKPFFDPTNFLVGFIATIVTLQIEMYFGFKKSIADNKYETSKKDIDTLHGLINTLYKSVEKKCTLENCNEAMCAERKDCFFREFLIKDFRNLYNAIERINDKNEYQLDKNIKEYHTIAISQLERQNIKTFNVIHFIANDEEADEYDVHFLDTLLSKQYLKTIKWLFIGSLDQKKSYQYLREHLLLDKKAKDVFKFYVANTNTFQSILNQKGSEVKKYVSLNEPNIGIYGNRFIFTQKPEEVGYFYRGDNIRHINSFFDDLIGSKNTRSLSFDEIMNLK